VAVVAVSEVNVVEKPEGVAVTVWIDWETITTVTVVGLSDAVVVTVVKDTEPVDEAFPEELPTLVVPFVAVPDDELPEPVVPFPFDVALPVVSDAEPVEVADSVIVIVVCFPDG